MPGSHFSCCCDRDAPAIRDRLLVLSGKSRADPFPPVFSPGSFTEGAFYEVQKPGVVHQEDKSLQSWFEQWEERQQMQLQQHEDATKKLIETLRKDLLSKFERLPVPKSEEMEVYVSSAEPSGEVKSPYAETTSAPCPEPTSGKYGFKDLNQAMLAASGYHRKAPPGKSSSNHTSISEIPQGADLYPAETEHGMPTWEPRKRLWLFVHSNLFTGIIGGLIILYAIVVGIMADYEIQALLQNEDTPAWFWVVDMSFTIVFSFEVSLRVLACGVSFLTAKEWNWNLFDLIVVLGGALDVMRVFTTNLGFMRILRIFRTVRMLRIIRVFRFFKELRLMVASIICSLASLTWAASLLIGTTYIFAVLLIQGAADYLHTTKAPSTTLQARLSNDFGSLIRTMYSLILAVSGGRSWGEFADPFVEISPWYGGVFTLFIIFVVFGALNILTGLFVESTNSVASFDKELALLDEMSRNESVVGQIRALFMEIDVDGSGTLTYTELKKNLKDERVRAYFSLLQMDVTEATGLFQLLDRDESGEVNIEEFINTCLRLKGSARSIDLAGMLFESKRFHTFVSKNMSTIRESVVELQEIMKVIHASAVEVKVP